MTAVVVPAAPLEAPPAPQGAWLRPAAARLLLLAAVMLAVPNLAVIGLHLLAQRSAAGAPVQAPIKNLAQVDDRLWRGAAPSAAGYEALARHGVATVVDLRAEDDIHVDQDLLRRLGITRVHLPLRDGQTPTAAQVQRFLDAVAASPGRAFVHCGAGVGRTGTMAASYLVATGQATPGEALRRNLSVGPPSLEQLAFSAGLEPDRVRRPAPLMVAISRAVDAPRRAWVLLRK